MNQFQWSKPELSPDPGTRGYYAHEAEGDDPIKLAPNEMDPSHERVEAPDGAPNMVHELPVVEAGRHGHGRGSPRDSRRGSAGGGGGGGGGLGAGVRSWSQRARESRGVSALSSGFGSGRSGGTNTTTSGTGGISSASPGHGSTPRSPASGPER